jgi:putative ABC transport system ATP-binding protein
MNRPPISTVFPASRLLNLLTKLNREQHQTVVMVTHEREYALGVHRIIYMEDGVVVKEEKLREL